MKNNIMMSATTSKMDKRVDFYSATRQMSLDVAEYIRVVVAKKDINLTYANKCKELNETIERVENLSGSVFAGRVEELKANAYEALKKYEEERKQQLEEQATYVKSENDKRLEKVFKSKKGVTYESATEALIEWFMHYNLDITDTYLLEEIMDSFGSVQDIKTLVRSDSMKIMKVDYNKVLQKVYGICYEHMVGATIKPAQIPELVRDKYMPKKSKKSNK